MNVFDWDKAVEIMLKEKAQNVDAGLDGDMYATAAHILIDGKPLTDARP